MSNYIFYFYPYGDDRKVEISVPAESKAQAERIIREMIPDPYFDDGLFFGGEK